jgi:hypothetical protein
VQPSRRIDPELIAAVGWRPADVEECRVGTGQPPEASCHYALDVAPGLTFTIMDRYVPVGMFGATPYPDREGVGLAWLLASRYLFGVIPSFNEQVPMWFNVLNHTYPLLTNWCDERNKLALNWLETRCACTMVALEPYGNEQRPFWRFERRLV